MEKISKLGLLPMNHIDKNVFFCMLHAEALLK